MAKISGHTVHVVPGEGRAWNVVDLRRRGSSFPSRKQALEYARSVAAENQPSQVVMFDALGRVHPVARYQLPSYHLLRARDDAEFSLFESILKGMLFREFVASGIAVRGELADRVEREAEQAAAKARRRPRSARRRTA